MSETYEKAEELAKRIWVSGSSDHMVPWREAERRWENIKVAKDQRYLNRVHDAFEFLIHWEEMEKKND